MSVGADYEFEYEYGTPSVVNDKGGGQSYKGERY